MLESYNRTFADLFPITPSLMLIGQTLDEETDNWVMKREYSQMDVYDAARKRRKVEWPVIPKDFDDFKIPKKILEKRKEGKKGGKAKK